MSKLNQEIGEIIRKRRKSIDYTQEKLAELSDLNVTFIGEMERGHCNPSIDTLHKISQALAMPLSQLIYAAEGQPEEPAEQIQKVLTEYTDKILNILKEK